MAKCRDCGQDMVAASTCTADAVRIGAWAYPRRRNSFRGGRCGDCGVAAGGYHHLGCDLERCPRCGRQLITCFCGGDTDVEPIWTADPPGSVKESA